MVLPKLTISSGFGNEIVFPKTIRLFEMRLTILQVEHDGYVSGQGVLDW